MRYSVVVEVHHKEGVADPQGATIERALPTLGFAGVSGVARRQAHPLHRRGRRRGRRPGRGRRHGPPVPHQPGHRGRHGPPRRARRLMAHRVGVVLFPGSNCELDVVEAVGRLGGDAEILWHGDATTNGVDAVVIPGGFAHGDYLRCGAIARFSPVMDAVAELAAAGGTGARHLQRVPGPHRGRPAARRPPEEPRPQVPLHHRRPAGRDHRRPLTRAVTAGDGAAHPDQPLRGQLHRRRRRPWPSCGPRIGSCSATSTTPTARSTTSPASATRAATWWADAAPRAGHATSCSAPPTALRAPQRTASAPPRPSVAP